MPYITVSPWQRFRQSIKKQWSQRLWHRINVLCQGNWGPACLAAALAALKMVTGYWIMELDMQRSGLTRMGLQMR